MNNLHLDDRRATLRMPFVSKAICKVDNIHQNFFGMLRDISTFALFMEIEENRPAACSQCEITIVFDGDHSCLTIDKVIGEVVRSDKDGVAVRFYEKFEWLILVPLLFRKNLVQQRKS